jgi:7,8-dihydropterin-6-yl-methyl-4-(beta-D-ribofuranosyl)aminobenzene 5'-phosphate synthase
VWRPDQLVLDDQALAELAPDYLVPAHCTGWKATYALASRFPGSFLQNAVGTRFEFTGTDQSL